MTEDEIFEKIKEVFIEDAGLEDHEITREAKFFDLELDSLDALTIVASLEDKFDIIISDERVAELETVGDVLQSVIDTINNKIK